MAEQGPILHQTKHSDIPPRWAGLFIALSAGPKNCHEF
ncbi:hypothetical protein CDS [Bradyrhizobium sp.]|nr:hypothetical protein CDS [Bradyrhizobium sp.]